MSGCRLFLTALTMVALSCVGLRAQSGITAQNGRQVTCASDDGKRHLCQVTTQYGVRMVNQRSGSPCIEGQTWGFNRNGIWVDRGCRADFWLGGGYHGGGGNPGGGGGYPNGGQQISCSSDNGKRNFCNADTSRGVRMVNQRSGSPCIEGQTWGSNRNGIWVDKGCRADFRLGGGYHGGGGGGYPGGGGGYPPSGGQITCSSDDGKRNFCNADTSGGVRMINQRSGSPCVQGQTWGFNKSGIWVDRGCRADFQLGR